ncbi:MAG: sulfatase [Acidobacteriota bacterium]
MKIRCGLRAALAAALALAAPDCGTTPVDIPKGPNVLLITVDTLRLDRLSCYGGPPGNTPSIDALAQSGVRFGSVEASRGLTWPALTSLLTGLHPRTHQVRLNGDQLEENIKTLPEMLKSAGYNTAGFLSNMCDAPNRGIDTFYCAWTDQFGLPVGRMPLRWASHEQPGWDTAITNKALDFIRKPHRRPFFAWLHYINPHKPYDPVEEYVRPDGDTSFDPQDEVLDQHTLDGVSLNPAQKQRLMAVYDSQVTGVDAHIGAILRSLDEQNLAGNTLVIFSADHGEELGDHQIYFYHYASVYQQVLAVPWIMRWPGHIPEGVTVADPVAAIDITPTVLDLLQIDAAAPFEGSSRLPLVRRQPGAQGARHTFAEWKDRILIVGEGNWRYIWNPDRKAPQGRPFMLKRGAGFHIDTEELYDLSQDPLELHNIVAQHEDRRAALRAVACDFLRARPFTLKEQQIKPEVQSRLRSLGYIQEQETAGRRKMVSHCGADP